MAAGCLAGAAQADAPLARFVEETESAGLQSRYEGDFEFQVGGGVASFDCDGDGLPEVYVTGGVTKAKFYRNRSSRGGPIRLVEERSGLELTGANGAGGADAAVQAGHLFRGFHELVCGLEA